MPLQNDKSASNAFVPPRKIGIRTTYTSASDAPMPNPNPNVSPWVPSPEFPQIDDIYDVVPMPLIHWVEPPPGSDYSKDSIRLVRDVTQEPPSFNSYPLCFTLPSKVGIFEDFVKAMSSTIKWTGGKGKFNGSLGVSAAEADAYYQRSTDKRPGPDRIHETTHNFWCPCFGPVRRNTTYVPKTPQKRNVQGKKCGCNARFIMKEVLGSQLWEVTWYWKHSNHNPYSLEDMQKMRMAPEVQEWLDERVLAGMSWRAIKKLRRCPDLFPVRVFLSLLLVQFW